ncbi:MAG: glycerate kinase [Fibrobacterota bacterium]
MKIVIASDSYKGCCSSLEIGSAIETGIRRVFPDADIVTMAVADGGEGTVDALVNGRSGIFRTVTVQGPVDETVDARYGIINSTTAIIEMAAASGLPLVHPEKKNPLYTTTYGTGQLIKDALDCGCKKIILGIGGSATNDGGAGMAQALGVRFLDSQNRSIGKGAIHLDSIKTIDMSGLDTRIPECQVIGLCDVSNPLTGDNGASFIYARQKGAKEEDLPLLDKVLSHFAQCIEDQLGIDVKSIPGAGAAGGLAAGLIAFCNGSLHKGIDTILKLVDFEKEIRNADLVITGEGALDGQSINGKVPVGVALTASKYGIPVIAITGTIGDRVDKVYNASITSVMSIINAPMSLDNAIQKYHVLAADASERLMRVIRIYKK